MRAPQQEQTLRADVGIRPYEKALPNILAEVRLPPAGVDRKIRCALQHPS